MSTTKCIFSCNLTHEVALKGRLKSQDRCLGERRCSELRDRSVRPQVLLYLLRGIWNNHAAARSVLTREPREKRVDLVQPRHSRASVVFGTRSSTFCRPVNAMLENISQTVLNSFFRSIRAEMAHPSVLAHHVRQQTLNKYKCHHSIQRLDWMMLSQSEFKGVIKNKFMCIVENGSSNRNSHEFVKRKRVL